MGQSEGETIAMSVTAPTDKTLYAEDLAPGTTFELGTYAITLEEITEFARQWDPQAIHLDEVAAAAGHFGGIIASGLHSMAISQRLAVDHTVRNWAFIAGRSLDDVQLPSPIRPGAVVSGRLQVGAVEPKGPGRALVSYVCSLHHGETLALSYRASAYVSSREEPERDTTAGVDHDI